MYGEWVTRKWGVGKIRPSWKMGRIWEGVIRKWGVGWVRLSGYWEGFGGRCDVGMGTG